ncbi:hypothetical protein, partial [Leptospira idonii]|uniref:hypothetical protein n=1 Tax=Leptospira idonii TaxID=1193500 RepID=UPI00143837D5
LFGVGRREEDNLLASVKPKDAPEMPKAPDLPQSTLQGMSPSDVASNTEVPKPIEIVRVKDGQGVGGDSTTAADQKPKTGTKAGTFGDSPDQLKTKIETLSKILPESAVEQIKQNDEAVSKLKQNKEKYADLANLLNDRSSFDQYMKSPLVSDKEKAFLQYFKDSTIDIRGGAETLNTTSFENTIRDSKLAEIKNSKAYKELVKYIDTETTRLNQSSNKIVNAAIIQDAKRYSVSEESQYAGKLDKNILNKSEKDFYNYTDNFVSTRSELASDRLDITKQLGDLAEKQGKATNAGDVKKIQEQINQLQTRLTQMDSNMLNHTMSMQVGENP